MAIVDSDIYLEICARHPRWEIAIDYEATMDGDISWCVWDVRGSVNDREWIKIASGVTPKEALQNAVRGLK